LIVWGKGDNRREQLVALDYGGRAANFLHQLVRALDVDQDGVGSVPTKACSAPFASGDNLVPFVVELLE
jgi:hypothetical protein